METRTLPVINKLAGERLHLYDLASEGGLSLEQRQRLTEINDRLPGLWDEYRREIAEQHGPATRISGSERLQKAVIASWNKDKEERQAA